MANITKGFGIGDTVWVAYPFPSSLGFIAQSRIVKDIRNVESTSDSLVTFDDGADVFDGSGALQAVFTTEALASTQIIDNVIIKALAASLLDATLSSVSTAGNAVVGIIRSDT